MSQKLLFITPFLKTIILNRHIPVEEVSVYRLTRFITELLHSLIDSVLLFIYSILILETLFCQHVQQWYGMIKRYYYSLFCICLVGVKETYLIAFNFIISCWAKDKQKFTCENSTFDFNIEA